MNLESLNCGGRPFKKSSSGLTGGSNDGSQLELVYHAAAVVASRGNGLKGCNLLQFLTYFIRELESTVILKIPVSDSKKWTTKPLTVKGLHDFVPRRVPILAPMTVPGWPESVTELLFGYFRDFHGFNNRAGLALQHNIINGLI